MKEKNIIKKKEPSEIFLGERNQIFNENVVTKNCHGYCIPLLHTLKRMLKNPGILSCIGNPNFSNDNILRDAGDGQNSRNHPLIQIFPDCLRIRLYFDDAELTNESSSYTCKVGLVLSLVAFLFKGT